jgi:hypothetical protein
VESLIENASLAVPRLLLAFPTMGLVLPWPSPAEQREPSP